MQQAEEREANYIILGSENMKNIEAEGNIYSTTKITICVHICLNAD